MKVKCDLCSNVNSIVCRDLGEYKLYTCSTCKLMWVNPKCVAKISVPSSTHNYWASEIYAKNEKNHLTRFEKQIDIILNKFTAIDFNKKPQILEIGSGIGTFLSVCKSRGIQAIGCDISEWAVLEANSKGLETKHGTIDMFCKDNEFDIVCGFNIIEHLESPSDFLTQIKRVLKKDGLLVIETPIQESLMHFVAHAAYELTFGRVEFFSLTPNGHLYKFSKKTFKMISDLWNFELLYWENINSPFGEIWGKSSLIHFSNNWVYQIGLPLTWLCAHSLRLGNRLFTILRNK